MIHYWCPVIVFWYLKFHAHLISKDTNSIFLCIDPIEMWHMENKTASLIIDNCEICKSVSVIPSMKITRKWCIISEWHFFMFQHHSHRIYFFVMGNSTLIDRSRGAFDLCQAVVMKPWKQIQEKHTLRVNHLYIIIIFHIHFEYFKWYFNTLNLQI